MLLLSIDTSTRGCSVALHGSSGLLALNELFTDKSSSSMLTTLIKCCVEQAGCQLVDLDAIAVAKGPGSYTGLRVAVSTAKGLCYALGKPLVGINTLEAMALQINAYYPGHFLCPMIDARRMEVYAAIFNDENLPVEPTRAIIMNNDSFATLLKSHKVVFFGDGAAKCKPLLLEHPNAVFPDQQIRPSAKTVGALAIKAFQNNNFENLAAFEPYYLKDFMSPPTRKQSVTA